MKLLTLKHTNMKKILFAALAALAITSCSQNEEIDAPAQKAEIKFNTAVSKALRANTTINANFTQFKAYAYSNSEDFKDATSSFNSLINGEKFEKNGENWAVTDKTFYWPKTDKVSFFAYSLTTDNATWKAPTIATPNAAPQLTYTVATTAATQEDLLVSEKMNQTSTTSATNLVFQHALTKIGFKIKGTGKNVTYTVTELSVTAKDKGTYTYKADATNPSNILGSWQVASDATSQTYTLLTSAPDDDITIAVTETESINESLITPNTADNNSTKSILMLIPQELTNVSINIKYKAEITDGGELYDLTATGETLKFPTSNSWDAGKALVYTLVLSPGENLQLTGSTSDSWDLTEGGTPSINN